MFMDEPNFSPSRGNDHHCLKQVMGVIYFYLSGVLSFNFIKINNFSSERFLIRRVCHQKARSNPCKRYPTERISAFLIGNCWKKKALLLSLHLFRFVGVISERLGQVHRGREGEGEKKTKKKQNPHLWLNFDILCSACENPPTPAALSFPPPNPSSFPFIKPLEWTSKASCSVWYAWNSRAVWPGGVVRSWSEALGTQYNDGVRKEGKGGKAQIRNRIYTERESHSKQKKPPKLTLNKHRHKGKGMNTVSSCTVDIQLTTKGCITLPLNTETSTRWSLVIVSIVTDHSQRGICLTFMEIVSGVSTS